VDIGFQFEAIWQDNDVIEVRVLASNGIFCGRADVYVGIGQLEELSASLRGFPTQSSDTREVVFGAFGPKSAGGGVSMRFYCADGAGHALVDSKLESDHGANGRAQSVALTLSVEASAVDLFIDELRQLGANRAGMACLRGMA
jgi:hypothetical protein